MYISLHYSRLYLGIEQANIIRHIARRSIINLAGSRLVIRHALASIIMNTTIFFIILLL